MNAGRGRLRQGRHHSTGGRGSSTMRTSRNTYFDDELNLRSMKSGKSSTVGGRLRERKLLEKNDNSTAVRTQKVREARKSENFSNKQATNQKERKSDTEMTTRHTKDKIMNAETEEETMTGSKGRAGSKMEEREKHAEATLWKKPSKTTRMRKDDGVHRCATKEESNK